jgi:hypothetical protein
VPKNITPSLRTEALNESKEGSEKKEKNSEAFSSLKEKGERHSREGAKPLQKTNSPFSMCRESKRGASPSYTKSPFPLDKGKGD